MSTDLERELERTTQLRGFRYGLHDFLAHVLGVEALKKNNDHAEANYVQKSLIDRKTKELLIIGVCVSQRDTVAHLQVHMHAAQKAGATPEEILAVLMLLSTWVDGRARVAGLEAWRATYRPDLPPIDRVVELR